MIVTDDCYLTDPIDASGDDNNDGLLLSNICTPKCTTEQLASFAYYLNRVKDLLQWLNNYAVVVADDIKDEIDHYNNVVVPAKNQPSYQVKSEKFPTLDEDRFYYSFVAGFFNPTGGDLSLAIEFGTTGEEIKENSMRFRIGSDGIILTEQEVTSSVPCLKVGILEFVVLASPDDEVTIGGTFGALTVDYSITLT